MAREIPDLVAEVRTGTGKGAARQARREGYVPGIIYGDGKEPTPIKLNYNYLLKRLKQGRFLQTLFNLKVEGGEEVHVICRGVQRDVVKDLPTHVDFMRIHDESRINLFIHVTGMSDMAWERLRDAGAAVSLAVPIEMNMAHGTPPMIKALQMGLLDRPRLAPIQQYSLDQSVV